MAKPKETLVGNPPTLSRTALEELTKCPRCFYLYRRKKLKPPERIPFTLASATDALLKNEFDAVRTSGRGHPIWEREGLDVQAYLHPDLEIWRSNFKGIRVVHAPTGATISGAVDDIWEHRSSGELYIVDYKSTSKQGTPNLESGFGEGYKRQMEIYQWLFRSAGFPVSSIGYFLYVNGDKQGGFYESGVGRMRFETTLIAYEGNTGWVDDCIAQAVACYTGDDMPASGADCDTCRYVIDRRGFDPPV
jgi:hypothetical protein